MRRRLLQRRAAEEDIAEQVAHIAAERPAVAHCYAIALGGAFERIRQRPEIGVLQAGAGRGDSPPAAAGAAV